MSQLGSSVFYLCMHDCLNKGRKLEHVRFANVCKLFREIDDLEKQTDTQSVQVTVNKGNKTSQ